ncbi:DUF3307 domain-containing protein [Thalassovita aquimarina]
MLCLVVKHYVADYLLQFPWMIRQKGNPRAIGGYAHVGIHALGTVAVFGLLGLPLGVTLALALAEAVTHYLIDFTKDRTGNNVTSSDRPRLFWAIHGLDQLFHSLTYLAMTYVLITAIS